MAQWNDNDIRRQYDRAFKNQWIDYFREASKKFDIPVATLMGIASRESNMRKIAGDVQGGVARGYGLMQVDTGTDPNFASSGAWKDARKSILRGAAILADKREQIRNQEGKRTIARTRGGQKYPFVGAKLTEQQLLQVAIAAYNGGLMAYRNFTVYGNPDRGTTGKDYSADVLKRSRIFDKYLSPGPRTLPASSGVSPERPEPLPVRNPRQSPTTSSPQPPQVSKPDNKPSLPGVPVRQIPGTPVPIPSARRAKPKLPPAQGPAPTIRRPASNSSGERRGGGDGGHHGDGGAGGGGYHPRGNELRGG